MFRDVLLRPSNALSLGIGVLSVDVRVLQRGDAEDAFLADLGRRGTGVQHATP